MNVPEEDRICGNCRHWDIGDAIEIKVDGKPEPYAPCMIDAIEPDAGRAMVFLSADGNCKYHTDAFEPCAEYEENAILAEEQWARTA